jgi:rhamnosyl/mannosyltransferase
MKKTILHISKYYYPDLGGIETIAKSMADGLKDFHNVVVCFATDGKSSTDTIDGITVYRVNVNFSVKHQDVALSYYHTLRSINREYAPEFVHLHCPNPYLYPIVLRVFPKTTKIVLHWHSDIISKGIIYQLIMPFERAILKRADLIVATSPNYIHPTSPIYPYREKTDVVPNGIITSDFDPRPGDKQMIAEIKARYGHKPLVLFIGRHIAYKGLDLLLEAEKHLKSDCKIIIAGSGPLTEQLKRQCHSPRIVFAGRLSNDELRCHAYAADVFAFPSNTKAEAFGVALAEAMYCSTAPVVFHLEGSGVNWVSVKDKTGIEVPLADTKAFADGIDRLLADESLRGTLAEASRQRVATMFTDKAAVGKMNEIYHRLNS